MSTRLFVGNLSYKVRWQDLKDFMGQVGPVVRADVLQTPNGLSRGCGLVEYDTPEQAQAAIDQLNNVELLGRPVLIREDREQGSSSLPSFNISKGGIPNAVFVENLAYATNWTSLKDHFRSIGSIVRADVQTFRGRSKGRGVVVFEDEASVERAIHQLNGSLLQGRPIRVRRDLPAENRPMTTVPTASEPSSTLFIHNLPWTTSDEELAAVVAAYAPVVVAQVQLQSDGRSAGCGSVQLESTEAATAVLERLNGSEYKDRKLTVSYV